MLRWPFAILLLLCEAFEARRDARVRFLITQVEMLRRKLDRNRVILCPEDRARLLQIGNQLGHDVKDVLGIVTRQTYRRWVRELQVDRKPRRVGRPRVSTVRRKLILRFAKENIGWGYRRIVGELHKLHLPVGRSSIRRILRDAGILPPPYNRRESGVETPWRKFIRVHVNTLVACDFFTKQVLTPFGVRTAYCLFFIHLASRKVFICPSTYHPDKRWITQQARNAQMWFAEEGIEPRILLRDRDAKFAPPFDQVFRDADIRIVKARVQAPNANAFAESWVGSLKRECLSHFLCFSRSHLNHILDEYVRFYNNWRPHQGLDNRPLGPTPAPSEPTTNDDDVGDVRCRKFLGGLLRHYYRESA